MVEMMSFRTVETREKTAEQGTRGRFIQEMLSVYEWNAGAGSMQSRDADVLVRSAPSGETIKASQ